MSQSRVVTWLAAVLILASVLAGWIAIGRLASATQRGLHRTEESLTLARDLAASTSESATELQRVVGVIGEGLGSTSKALVATRQVSTNVRGLLDIASFIGSVENLTDSLKDAEATIAEVEIDLAEASGSIGETTPLLDDTVAALRLLPADLDRAIAEVNSSATRVGEQVWLWRLAITAGGAAVLLVLILLGDLRRTVNRRSAAQP
jgi:hypothetical protein